jgi:DNA polymerase-3 subunit epsilon
MEPADGTGHLDPLDPGPPAGPGPACEPSHLKVAAGTPGPLPRFAVVDIETSGLSTRRHRILQIAVVTVRAGVIVDEWSSLIALRWPLQRIGPRRVHGIDRATLRHAPRLRDVMTQLARRVDGAVLTAHNIEFDWPFLQRAARASGTPLSPADRLCTLRLSRMLDPERTRSHRLADVCDRYGVTNVRPHDAVFDARATAEILPYLLAEHHVDDADDLEALYEPR